MVDGSGERGDVDPAAQAERLRRAEAEIARLQQEVLQSRAEVRALAEAIPAAVSRKAVLRSVVADLIHPSRIRAAARRRTAA